MVYLPDIVDKINTVLKSRFGKYPKAEYHGLTTTAVIVNSETSVSFPSIIGIGGSPVHDISFSTKIPLLIYHRALTTNYSVSATQKSYGDGELINRVSTTSLRLVCAGIRKQIAVQPEELSAIIADALPTGANTSNIKYMKIYPGTIQYDAQIVFASEFKGIPFNIGPERFLFSLTYTIESGYMNGCFNNCDC